MSMKERLADDLKLAMKNKDIIRKNTVQLVRAAILQYEKDNKVTLDDEGILDIIAKELKKRRDVLPDYQKSNRQDLIDDLNSEISILLEYLPKQLTTEEIEEIVKVSIAETKATSMQDMGRLMANLMPKIKGLADGKEVNQIVKKLL